MYACLAALFPGLPGWAGTRKVKPTLILLKQRESEWQWHQLGHMQVCTSLQTDNHASTPPLRFVQAGCPTNSVIALKATKSDRDVTVTYSRNCSSFKLDSLHTWRQQQTNELFNQIVNKPERCLHYRYLVCRRTVCLWSSPTCQRTAVHLFKD